MTHATLQHQEELRKYWNEQSVIFEKIKSSGDFENYIKSVPDIDRAFEGRDLEVCCVDEGTPYGCMRFAGSLILNIEHADTIVQLLQSAGVRGVYSHAGCGAVALYATQNNLDPSRVDEYAIDWAKKFANKLSVPYKGHLGSENMPALKRPTEFHIARVIYYDGTGRFNPDHSMDLLPGFVISRRYHVHASDALNEVKIAISIATGNHGFGDLIDEHSPIHIIVIGDESNQEFSVDVLKKEIESIVGEYNGKVVMESGGYH